MKKDRIAYWDNIKGLLIILVVFGHFLFDLQDDGNINFIVDAIYYVHMPAFVFVAGFFSKSENSRSHFSLLKLLIAYFLLNAVFVIQSIITAGGDESSIHFLSAYHSEWFLMALIIWRIVTPYLSKIKFSIVIAFLIAIIAGFLPDVGGNAVFSINKVAQSQILWDLGFLS